MNPLELIDSYVKDVARHLPRRQRDDVAFELRALLQEESAAHAAESGRAADAAGTLELLRNFGHPLAVAARYRAPLTIIDPADGRTFLRVGLGGAIAIALLGLLDVFTRPLPLAGGVPAAGGVLGVIGAWWTWAVVTAPWWPGVLVLYFGLAAHNRRRWPRRAQWQPRAVDQVEVNRRLYTLGILAALAGLLVLANPAWLLERLFAGRVAPVAYQAFVFSEEFLSFRAPLLLAVMAAQLLLFGVLVVQGRWQPLTRKLDVALGAGVCAVLVWLVAGGAIYRQPAIDSFVKMLRVFIVAGSLVNIAFKVKHQLRIRPPLGIRGSYSS